MKNWEKKLLKNWEETVVEKKSQEKKKVPKRTSKWSKEKTQKMFELGIIILLIKKLLKLKKTSRILI